MEKDGVTLPEKVWLAYVLCFIPSEERQLLEVPAEQDRDAFNGNVGYTMADLEASVKKVDPRTCKKFRQQWCTEPLAKRIIKLHKLSNPSLLTCLERIRRRIRIRMPKPMVWKPDIRG